jgi:hypothetical protein
MEFQAYTILAGDGDFFYFFVRLLPLRPLLAYCASLGYTNSEDDCGIADGM